MKKRIICFGDSNTWGYDPVNGGRYDDDTRWPMLLQSLLGEEYQIIEEGQSGRTIACPDPWEWGTKCGLDYILPMIESHIPFDMIIIMLGGNDLKKKFGLPAPDVAGSMQNMLKQVRAHLEMRFGIRGTRILVVSPPVLGENLKESRFADFFDLPYAMEQSRKLAGWLEIVAQQFGCEFFDAAAVTAAGPDGLHLLPEGHLALAEALAKIVR